MIRHCLKLAYRSFVRYKGTFTINLVGLSSGLACAILIYLWLNDELTVDKFHEKDSRIFQVMQIARTPEYGNPVFESTPAPLVKALVDEMPEIEQAVAVYAEGNEDGILETDDGKKSVRAVEQYVTPDFFNVFSFPLIRGEKDQVLKDKYGVVISDELAATLFDSETNALGKAVNWDQKDLSGRFEVVGIFKKTPVNSTMQFDILLPFEWYIEKRPNVEDWTYNDPRTYVLLKSGASFDQVNSKLATYLQGKSKGIPETQSMFLRRYSDKYLYGRYENGVQAGGRIEYVRLFSLVAVFILVIACINFMNLSTAKASRRLKEIGVKKAIGAQRRSLIFQYFGESLLLAFISLALAILFVLLFLPKFNDITEKQLHLIVNWNTVLSLFSITLFTGIVSGIYPALHLSGFKAASVLKGKLPSSAMESWTRRGLVIFQFVASVILIVSVVVVYEQLQFIQTKQLGYQKDNLLLFRKEGKVDSSLETFLNEIVNVPGVVNASTIRGDMTKRANITSDLNWENKKQEEKIAFAQINSNYDLIETLGIEISEGRAFSRDFGADSSKIILNESAVAVMGLNEPVGKIVTLWGENRQVIGVVKDFHFESFYEPVKPCFFILTPHANNVVVRIRAGNQRETITKLSAFYEAYTGLPFDFQFLDEGFRQLYNAENRLATLSRYFAGVAIIIACLGLLGLAIFTTERRMKEVGIRKILGSSNISIINLLATDFIKMVVMAVMIGIPISYLLARNWLDKFTYRIPLQVWFFVAAAFFVVFIAWSTIVLQIYRASRINPTQCLKED